MRGVQRHPRPVRDRLHRPSGDIQLPTLAVNRSILALQSPLSEGDLDDAIRSTLAFHPDTASDEHILGACYEGLG